MVERERDERRLGVAASRVRAVRAGEVRDDHVPVTPALRFDEGRT
ncbi:MAG TPA: hypothetical protein VHJ20_11775 [Polyangia bacterium]|nr:hypothetical protein [Polyangia bacterium]